METERKTDFVAKNDTIPGFSSLFYRDVCHKVVDGLGEVLLASFRKRLRLIEAYNRFAMPERAQGYQYREVKVMIVAPACRAD